MIKRSAILFLSCFTFILANSQDLSAYKETDGYVKELQINPFTLYDLKTVQRELKYHFKDEDKLVRAAYVWITNNINYDCRGYKMGGGLYQLTDVIAERKSICEGYASLFKNFCDAFDINCLVIHGYAPDSNIDKLDTGHFKSNHAWNVVSVNGKWKLIDATWGSGGCAGDYSSFIRSFYENWFYTKPEEMIKTHFPEDSSWQLLDKPFTRKEFLDSIKKRNLAFAESGEGRPRDSVISKTVGDVIRFIHLSKDSLNTILISGNELNKIDVYDTIRSFEGGYYYDYKVTLAGDYRVDVSYFFMRNEEGESVGTNMETYYLKVKYPAKNKMVPVPLHQKNGKPKKQ